MRTPPVILAATLLIGCERRHAGERLVLDWSDASATAVFRVTEDPGSGWKQNSRLHVERAGRDPRVVVIDDDAAFSTVALVRYEHWLLVVCRGVDEVWAGYDYDTGALYGEGEWASLPFTKWSGQGEVVAERTLREASASPANFPRPDDATR